VSRGRRLAAAALTALLAAPIIPVRAEQPAPGGWRPFKATWTLSGTRHLLPTEGARPAGIVHLTGPLAVTSGEGLGRGFLGEVIGFDDGTTLLVGRAVLTDEKGDRIYCSLKAEPVGTGRKATGTITGGTGRYVGLQGTFGFAWQYVVDTGSEEISGHTMNFEGRTRLVATTGQDAPR
jgi:hypothetical protein